MKLLILETDENVLSVLKEDFESNDVIVDTCTDAQRALNIVMTETYDCVLLDIMLPGLDGIQFIEKLRENKIMVPVIIITSKDSIEDRVQALDSGADDFVIKPFDFRELFARVKAVARRYAGDRHPVMQCGELYLDPVARECHIEGQSISLRRREFDILEFLMNHENQVFTREQIISQVWQKEYDGTSNVVDVHIKYLRDKLRINDYDRIVVTVRGIGYKVACPDWN